MTDMNSLLEFLDEELDIDIEDCKIITKDMLGKPDIVLTPMGLIYYVWDRHLKVGWWVYAN